MSVVTVTSPTLGIVATPMNTVTLCFFIRCPMPPDSCLATARDRATTAGRSKPMPSAFRPNSRARCIR